MRAANVLTMLESAATKAIIAAAKISAAEANNKNAREKVDNTPKKIIVRGTVTVGDLAKLLHKDASEVIKKLIMLGVMATINQEIDLDTVQLIATEYGVEVEVKIPVEEDAFETFEERMKKKHLKLVRQLLRLWVTLIMVKQLCLMQFATPV